MNVLSVAHAAAASSPFAFNPSTLTWAKLEDIGGDFVVNILIAGLILVGTIFVARWASAAVEAGLGRIRGAHKDRMLLQFAGALVRWVVVLLGAIAVLERLGVRTTSIIAMLGAASLAIGLALQGALSNVAAGVLILVLRPYRVGDQVDVGGQSGRVARLDLFTTELRTLDNRKVVVPNAKAMGDVIVNRTAYGTRRVEVEFNVAREGDLDRVFGILTQAAKGHLHVLDDPEPWAGLTAITDNAYQVSLYAFTASDDWFQTTVDLRKAAADAFRREGVVIPYPRQVSLSPDERSFAPSADGPAPQSPVGRA